MRGTAVTTTDDHDDPMYRIVSIDADNDDIKFQPSASIDLSPNTAVNNPASVAAGLCLIAQLTPLTLLLSLLLQTNAASFSLSLNENAGSLY